MIKNRSTISINILSVLIILISVFIGVVGSTNAWFTVEQINGVEIIVNVGELKLNLYQRIVDPETDEVSTKEIYTYDQNISAQNKSYVELSGPIIPGENMALNLYLENKDVASVPMYVRFKFGLYVRGETHDDIIPVSLIREDASTIGFGQKTGATHDDYYYYQDANQNNVLFDKESSVDLMTHFKIDYSEMFEDESMIYTSSDALYIKLTIEASLISW